MLVLQLVASLVLFVCTIISTGRLGTIPVVKSSALATLFALRQHGNGTGYQAVSTSDPDGHHGDLQELRQGARQMVAKMEGGVMILPEQCTTTCTAGVTQIMSKPENATQAEDVNEAVAREEKSEGKRGMYETVNEITPTKM